MQDLLFMVIARRFISVGKAEVSCIVVADLQKKLSRVYLVCKIIVVL